MAIRRIGLTGGIGSGKSTVAALCGGARGATLVDTDAIARSLTEAGGAAMPAVRLEFGERLVDPRGALDRQRMRELAFADRVGEATPRSHLASLIGSRSACASRRAIAQSRGRVRRTADGRVVAMAATAATRILVIDCSEQTQDRARDATGRGGAREEVRRVIAQQAPRPCATGDRRRGHSQRRAVAGRAASRRARAVGSLGGRRGRVKRCETIALLQLWPVGSRRT